MSVSISRMQFLRGDLSGRRTALRPPWSLPESVFSEICTRCNACLDDCPHGLLRSGAGGFPVIDFSRGACSFCGECVSACAPGALTPKLPSPWQLAAQILESCLSLHGVLCRICGDRCELRAIRFRPALGGRSQPQVDVQTCSGCGACYNACPSHAIALTEVAGLPAS